MVDGMDEERRARHAGSFGGVAGDYAAARPSYPAQAVAWLAGWSPRDVLDLGAGTGKLTELLVAAGHRVTAVDPSTGMLEQLHVRLPGVATLVGAAEDVQLPDDTVDVVTVAQAWHWFDGRLAAAECARLLRPGGRLGLVWNERDESSGWVAAVWEPVNRDGATGMGLLAADWQRQVSADALFGPMEHAVFEHEQVLDRAAILRLISSRSGLAVLDPEARAALLGEVAAVLDTHPETRGRETLALPYVTSCFAWTRI